MDKELYEKICRVMTWYEHPEECPFEKESIPEEMYSTLLDVLRTFYFQ